MNRRRLSRPSLRITRYSDQKRASHFVFEVWNPFASVYQPARSVEDGLARVRQLADLICRMWVQRHPTRDALVDIPDAGETDGKRWAEFRINATTFQSYDTRYDDRPVWVRAAGITQALVATCTRVGCAPPESVASLPDDPAAPIAGFGGVRISF
jgi:hypothetical protein